MRKTLKLLVIYQVKIYQDGKFMENTDSPGERSKIVNRNVDSNVVNFPLGLINYGENVFFFMSCILYQYVEITLANYEVLPKE